jgi:hypothetical protein
LQVWRQDYPWEAKFFRECRVHHTNVNVSVGLLKEEQKLTLVPVDDPIVSLRRNDELLLPESRLLQSTVKALLGNRAVDDEDSGSGLELVVR